MKTTLLTIFIGLCVCANGISQNTLSDLKKFCETADMKYYIGKIQKNIEECHKAQCKKWKVDESVNAPSIDLSKQKTIPMLTVQFVNMENMTLLRTSIITFPLIACAYSHLLA